MTQSKQELEELARSVPVWWHSIDLGQGVVTQGIKSSEQLKRELDSIRLPDLRGKSVLDIGAYDGFFSFEAERRGAARVVALDHFVWSLDLSKTFAYWRECKERGIVQDAAADALRLHRDKLPGMLAYNTSHKALGSKVETVIADFMKDDLERLGTFDVVLFLGVLYHMEDPLASLRRLASFTRGLAVIETEAIALPLEEDRALVEFFPGSELNNDPTNFWAPNEKALVGLCQAAGFSRVEVVLGSPLRTAPVWKSKLRGLRASAGLALRKAGLKQRLPDIVRYRAIVHAWK